MPVTTAFRTESDESADGKTRHSSVVANRILFRKHIDGVPVVGGGATIEVTFTNDGSVETFSLDWPTYKATSDIRLLLHVNDILERTRYLVAVSTTTPTSIRSSDTLPLELNGDTKVVDIQCGYYDPGFLARRSNSGTVRGCTYHVLIQKPGPQGVVAGLAGAVPTAVRTKMTPTAESSILLGLPAASGVAPRNAP